MKNKKLLYAIGLLLVTILVTGCGKEIAVKNGSKVAVSTKEQKYTATEYYNKIKKDNISKLVDMIDKDLLEKKYKTDDKETEAIDKQIEQIKSYYGSDENTYNSMLKQYFGADSEKELRENLKLEYKRKLAVEDYIKKNIKDSEIKKYYDEKIFGEVKASHILISINVKDDAKEEDKKAAEEKALKKAKKIIKELDSGKKFADLAKKYSDDKTNAVNGGDLGYFNLDEMVTEFSDAVKTLKKNEYTKEPVKTEYGYHIILKTGEKSKAKLKTIKKDIIEKIKDQKMSEDNTIYYTALKGFREDNKIKWNDDSLKKAYDDYISDLITSAIEAANSQQNS
ncbi:MAG: peptidylprolyl isomerase [Bacilli bacterium]|nr:peptidylprolyl isomerase [Bacilli bacterium]